MNHLDAAAAVPDARDGRRRQPMAVRLAEGAAYALLDLPVGVVLFTGVVTGLTVGLILVPLALVGVPVLLATGSAARWAAAAERARARLLLGVDVLEPPATPPVHGLRARALYSVRDEGTWRALGYSLLMLPWGVSTFTITVTCWFGGLGYATFPVWWWSVRGSDMRLLGWHARRWVDVVPVTLVGVLVLVLAIPITLGLRRLGGALVSTLLGPTAAQREELVAALTRSRRDVLEAAANERRRLERDLHDGVQQRLVALAVTLGRAERELQHRGDEQDPARLLVDQARGETKDALRELRDLVRGLSPAVLADRGLDAAVAGIAARAPVPVTVDIDPALAVERPDRPLEDAVYFVISEALTNVSRHAGASRAAIAVHRRPHRLVVTVSDDGVGGAHPRAGGGLAGLLARLTALEGSLRIESPSGGPTLLTATLPE